MSVETSAPKSGTSRKIYLPFIALSVFAAAWSALWYFSANWSEGVIDGWMAREATLGRNWTCPNRRTSGYPFRIELTCDNPTFAGKLGTSLATGSVKGFHAAAQIYQPNLVLADIDGPLELKTDDGNANLALSWKAMRLSLRGKPSALERASITADSPVLSGHIAGLDLLEGKAARLEAHIRLTPDRDDSAYDFAWTLTDAVIPALDAALGMPEPAKIEVSGTTSHLNFALRGNSAERLESWRAAGGRIEPFKASIIKGPAQADASGGFALDGAHRLTGRFNLSLSGGDAIMRRFGINPGMLNAGNILSDILGGKPKGEPGAAKALKLPLALENGRVAIGPIRLPVMLTPLY